MAIEWDLYLNGTGESNKLSSFGRKTAIRKIETVRERRSANGTLKQDILFVKIEFHLTYSYITKSALDIIEYWYDYYRTHKTPLTLYVYRESGLYDTYSVIPKPVDKTRAVRAKDNLFSGVKFTLIEV